MSWQIDQIVDELPLFMMRLEEFTNLLEEKLDFGAFKFCFIVGATIVVSPFLNINVFFLSSVVYSQTLFFYRTTSCRS